MKTNRFAFNQYPVLEGRLGNFMSYTPSTSIGAGLLSTYTGSSSSVGISTYAPVNIVTTPAPIAVNPAPIQSVPPSVPFVQPNTNYITPTPYVAPVPAVTPTPYVVPVPAVTPTPYVTPIAAVTPSSEVIKPTMTFKTVIVDKDGVVPANITINGKAYANTASGLIQVTNVPVDATVVITCLGYNTYTAKANMVPAKVILTEANNTLPELVITQPTTVQKASFPWAILLLLGAVTYGVSKSGKKGTDKALGEPEETIKAII